MGHPCLPRNGKHLDLVSGFTFTILLRPLNRRAFSLYKGRNRLHLWCYGETLFTRKTGVERRETGVAPTEHFGYHSCDFIHSATVSDAEYPYAFLYRG